MRGKHWLFIVGWLLIVASCAGSKEAIEAPQFTELEPGSKEDVRFAQFYYSALSAKLAGDYAQARQLLAGALAASPNHPAASYDMGQTYLHERKAAEAIPYLEAAYRSDPSNRWYAHVLAQAYEMNSDYQSASKIYLALIESNPDEEDYFLYLANAYEQSGEIEKALDSYLRFEQEVGVMEEVSLRRVALFEQLEIRDSIPPIYLSLIEKLPYEPRYYGLLANEYKRSGETDKALEVYETLAEKIPDDPLVQLSLFEYYEIQGKHDQAIDALEKAFFNEELDLDTKVSIVIEMYEQAIIDEKIKSDAFRLLNAILKAHPNEARSHAIHGDFLLADDRLLEAREAFYKSTELDETKYAVWNQIMLIDAQLNDREAMERDGSTAVELYPSQPLPFYILGYSLFLKGEYEEAIHHLEQGKGLVYNNPALELQFYSTLGDAYYQNGNSQQAWINYDRALRLDPTNIYVLNNYAYYLSVEKIDLNRALEMSSKCVDADPTNATYLDTKGWVLYQMKRYEEAVEVLSEALNYGGHANAEVLEHHGDAQFRSGNKAGAEQSWRRALELSEEPEVLEEKIKEGLND